MLTYPQNFDSVSSDVVKSISGYICQTLYTAIYSSSFMSNQFLSCFRFDLPLSDYTKIPKDPVSVFL